jgi:plastocyanin
MEGRRRAYHRALAGVVAAGTVLAGGVVSAGPPAAPPATHTVTIEAMRFQPESLAVHVGDQVIWINRDPFPHTVVSAAGRFRSPEIAPGQSWRHAVTRTGVLPYGCTLHPTMKAALRVE